MTIFALGAAALKQHPAVYDALRHKIYGRIQSAKRDEVFGRIYRINYWDDGESVSGPGSSVKATEHVRAALPDIVRDLGIKTLLDLPCGDFHWMQTVDLGCDYIGGDLVADLVAKNRERHPVVDFRRVDLLSDDLPLADAVLCRDCLVHMSLLDVQRALKNIRRSGARYLLATTFPGIHANEDTVTPYWRALNMELILGLPDRLVRDYSDDQKNDKGKHLGVWRL